MVNRDLLWYNFRIFTKTRLKEERSKNRCLLLIFEIICFISIIIGTSWCLQTFLAKKPISSKLQYEFCSHLLPSNISQETDATTLYQQKQLCQLNQETQFKKFIWIVTDALPLRLAEPILTHYREHSLVYKVNVKGMIWSHAVYTSFFTGQLSTNYHNEEIKCDHLFNRIKAAHLPPIEFIGSNFPLLSLYGGYAQKHQQTHETTTTTTITNPTTTTTAQFLTEQIFSGGITLTDHLEAAHGPGGSKGYKPACIDTLSTPSQKESDLHSHEPIVHPYLFDHDTPQESLDTLLSSIAEKNHSLLAYSTVLDAYQHSGEKNELCGWQRLIPKINRALKRFKDFADAHPEYLLILSSDHGQNLRKPSFVLHGLSRNDNEGFFLMYSPRLFDGRMSPIHPILPESTPNEQDYDFKIDLREPSPMPFSLPTIDVVDVCPTLASFLTNVDIPYMSLGVIPNHYGEHSPKNYLKLLKRNFLQMQVSAQARGITLETPPSIFDETSSSIDLLTDDEISQQIQFLKERLMAVQKQLYNPLTLPFIEISLVAVYLLMIVFFLIRMNIITIHRHPHSSSSSSSWKMIVGDALLTLACYTPLLINIAFANPEPWKTIYREGTIFRYVSIAFSLIHALYTLSICTSMSSPSIMTSWNSRMIMESSSKLAMNLFVPLKILLHEGLVWIVFYSLPSPLVQDNTSLFTVISSILAYFGGVACLKRLSTYLPHSSHISYLTNCWAAFLFLIELHKATSDWDSLIVYSIGFHLIGLVIYLLLAILIVYFIVKYILSLQQQPFQQSTLQHITFSSSSSLSSSSSTTTVLVIELLVGMNILLWYLFNSSIADRILISTVNYLFTFHLMPLFHSPYYHHQPTRTTTHPSFNQYHHYSPFISPSIARQALIVYSFNVVFLLNSSFGYLSLAINADYGVRGMTKVDVYPNFNAALMGIAKVGIFIIQALYLAFFTISSDSSFASSSSSNNNNNKNHNHHFQQQHHHKNNNHYHGEQVVVGTEVYDEDLEETTLSQRYHHDISIVDQICTCVAQHQIIGFMLVVFFCGLFLGFQLLEFNYIHLHAEEECIAMTGVVGLITCIYFALSLAHHVSSSAMRVHKE